MIDKKQEAISRTKFLKTLGLNGAAIFAATYCAGALTSCKSTDEDIVPSGTTIDLSTAAYSKLNTKGNYVIINQIVVAHSSDGKFVAVPQKCSHEGLYEVIYSNSEFNCTAHGARFSNAGIGLNGEGKGGLKLYTVTQTGTILTIS